MQRDEWADTLGVVFESIADNDAPEQSVPAFFVETADGTEQIVLSARGADGRWTQLSVCTPAEVLLRAVEIDYTQLRDEVMRLWETYPLDGTDRARKKKELARLSEEVRETSELLREIDPLGYFYVTQLILLLSANTIPRGRSQMRMLFHSTRRMWSIAWRSRTSCIVFC